MALDRYLSGGEPTGVFDYALTDPWSVAGAGIITQHPDFPYVMCELETARGCSHGATGGCSFCTEPFYGRPRYRSVAGVAAEVAALVVDGARHFRVGRQPDILAYGAGEGEYPAPRPDLLEELFSGIRAAAPDLKTLHIDNTNPATIARHEEKSREALAAICRHHTPGDVAAFGMETADPAVIAANNLKAQPDEVFRAIEIVNEVGGMRRDGIPELLPGLNFVCGLAGETPATYDKNEQFLSRVLAAGLMVRRVNIRQVMPFEGTPAYTDNTLGKNDRRFKAFKEFVRNKIDLPMLQRVFPDRHHPPRCADRSFRGTLVWPAAGLVPDPRGHPGESARPHRDRCGRGGLGDAVDHRPPAPAQRQYPARISAPLAARCREETGGCRDCEKAVWDA